MQESLKLILDIQEVDMKMMRLMRVKKERQKELEQLDSLRKELHNQGTDKEKEIAEITKTAAIYENKIQETNAKLKKLEAQQSSVKKVDEFNALTLEMTAAEKERNATEQRLSDLIDRRTGEEEILEKIRDSLKTSDASSTTLQHEIEASINLINEEGLALRDERLKLASEADKESLRIYERLLRNKKDRVIVPIEGRTCGGCHISLTAQHENLVRKGENIVFCEHCSRIHYWQESEALEGTGAATKRRRRRATA